MNTRETLKTNNLGHLEIGGVDCTYLANEFGTPLYVMDKAYIENMCRIYSETLNKEYGDGMVAYASKAFSCKEIYRIAKSQNIGVDVVSCGELYTALQVGFPPEKIIFHGNNKSYKDLLMAVENGVGTIVIDSYTEAEDLNSIMIKRNSIQNVLIRINPGVEAHTHHYIQTAKIDSKFGFSIATNEAYEIVKHVSSQSKLCLKGLHCHIGSQIFEKKSFELAVDVMIDFYKTIRDNLNLEFDTLNLGGGFGIWYTDEDAKKSYTEYSEYISAISNALNISIKKYGIKKPYLILEPGRSIVGEAGITLYRAGRIKNIKDIKNYIAIDGGMFDNPRFALYQAKYTVCAAEKLLEKPVEKYTLAGKCCESGDIIAEDCLLPKIKEGDLIAVFSTGAYNYSMASNYNRNFVPPVVMVKNGKSYYAVKPQTFEDLIRNDV